MRLVVGIWLVLGVVNERAIGQEAQSYIRVVEPDAKTIRLDVAVRTLAPLAQDKPFVQLVGAVHIADASFYADIQSFLDIHDLVLYEGVGGGYAPVWEPLTGDEGAALRTARRLAFLTVLGEVICRERGVPPQSIDDFFEAFDGVMRPLLLEASRDGWGREVLVEADVFDVVSLGADGRIGGEGAGADLRGHSLRSQSLRNVPDAGTAGLQRELAEALGLTFQLDAIVYTRPHWRNSDMNFGEIQEALGGEAAGEARENTGENIPLGNEASDGLKAADALFQTLSGESFLAKVSGFFLKMIGSRPAGQAIVKIMLVDTLTSAEALLSTQSGGLAELMDVLINQRNNAVVQDLRSVLAHEPSIEHIAIFYGAGHFGDLEARICEELGYVPERTIWIPAITIDLEEAGLRKAQVDFYRTILRQMIESQLEMMRANTPPAS